MCRNLWTNNDTAMKTTMTIHSISTVCQRLLANFIIAVAIAGLFTVLSGCQKDNTSVETVIPPGDLLSDVARVELHLPAKSELTLAKDADIAFIKTLDPAVRTTVADILKPTGRDFQVIAARPVGKYLLLWVSFPKVADGGIDLIYSTEKKKIVGAFCGGYRG